MPGMQGRNGEGEMSVLIKGMDMPLCCQQCPLCADEGRFCMAARRCIPIVGRIDWCPLVPVSTPHGRLIDRWELTETAMIDPDEGKYVAVYRADEVDEAPVVIEAEGRE